MGGWLNNSVAAQGDLRVTRNGRSACGASRTATIRLLWNNLMPLVVDPREQRERDRSTRLRKRLAVARPIPEAAPVTIATLFLKDRFTTNSSHITKTRTHFRYCSSLTFSNQSTFLPFSDS